MENRRLLCRGPFYLLAAYVLFGCATAPVATQSVPSHTQPTDSDNQVLAVTHTLLGTPYRYGGASPSGFDCSGLVQYVYREAGMAVPRTAAEQLRHAHRVQLSELRPGDLVFFRLSGRKISHVGIYVGGGRFIHAPSSGKPVSYARLENPYWTKRLVAAGRFI